MTRMTLTTPTIVARAQKRKMTVATCVSANGKPPSVIKWETTLKGEATFQETRNQNGTVTVRSNYVIVPSRETHKQKLRCIVTYRGERITDSVVLNVQCKNLLHFSFLKTQVGLIMLLPAVRVNRPPQFTVNKVLLRTQLKNISSCTKSTKERSAECATRLPLRKILVFTKTFFLILCL